MGKTFWSLSEVIETFEVDEVFLQALEEEDIIGPTCPETSRKKRFSEQDLEKLRLVKILHEEMGVNLAGVDIILRMRQTMFEMRSQFDTILEDLARSLKETLEKES